MYLRRYTIYILQAAFSIKFILQSSMGSAALGQSILSHSRYDLREFAHSQQVLLLLQIPSTPLY